MKKLVTIISVLTFIAAIGVIGTACGSTPALLQTTSSGAPAWVLKGSGAFNGDRGKAFYGVGSAPKMHDVSIQRDRAGNRARRAILQIFKTYIGYMMKDYARSTTAGEEGKEAYESDVVSVQKTVSMGDLNGAQIVDNWRDPADGTVYSLAVFDVQAVSEILSNKNELDAKLKDYVRANAAKAFDDLEKEEAKRGQ